MQPLVTYYLLTQTLYPQFARHSPRERARHLDLRILAILLIAGITVAIVVVVFRRIVLGVLFGQEFRPAVPLLFVLAWAIPLDFLTSWLSNAYIAWGMERKVLLCTVIAAASNVLLNVAEIPRYGAMAAAVNTLISYLIFLACLFWVKKTDVGLTASIAAAVGNVSMC